MALCWIRHNQNMWIAHSPFFLSFSLQIHVIFTFVLDTQAHVTFMECSLLTQYWYFNMVVP
jgi:hypothetical protein